MHMREQIIAGVMPLNKQEGKGSSAQGEGLASDRCVDGPSIIRGWRQSKRTWILEVGIFGGGMVRIFFFF